MAAAYRCVSSSQWARLPSLLPASLVELVAVLVLAEPEEEVTVLSVLAL